MLFLIVGKSFYVLIVVIIFFMNYYKKEFMYNVVI